MRNRCMFTYAPIHLLTHAPRPIGAPVNPPALRLLESAPEPEALRKLRKTGPIVHASRLSGRPRFHRGVFGVFGVGMGAYRV